MHVFSALRITPPSGVQCLGAQLNDWLSANQNDTAYPTRNVAISGAPHADLSTIVGRLLRAFFWRYNAPLRPLVQKLDPGSEELWRGVAWLPTTDAAVNAAAGPPGLAELRKAAAELRAALTAHRRRGGVGAGATGGVSSFGAGGSGSGGAVGLAGGGGGSGAAISGSDVATVGSARWFGTNPPPSVFMLGARDAGGEPLAELLLSQPKLCGGPLRFFDDDVRFVGGLNSVSMRYIRRAGGRAAAKRSGAAGAGCSTLVDTTPYLHTRWAAERIAATLGSRMESLRFIVVLSDPVDRAVRHWRSITSALARAPAPARGGGGERGYSALVGYTNGSTLSRKVRTEALDIARCISQNRADNSKHKELAVGTWQQCTTRACNWYECVVGGGLYYPQLRHWFSLFPRENFLLLEETQLRDKPALVADRVSAFLRLARPLAAEQLRAVAANHTHVPVGDAVRRTLRSFYDEHVHGTQALLHELAPSGWEAAPWLSAGSTLDSPTIAASTGGAPPT